MRTIGRFLMRLPVLVSVLCLVVLAGSWRAERIGDRLQVALPLLGWACAATRGEAGEYFVRYVVMFVSAHSAKRALGDAEVNRRPDGGGKGFPSAHTSTAVLGASRLVHDCIAAHPLARAGVVLAAAFVGASRIDAGKHDIWQVLAGAILGYACDRALRRPSALRSALGTALRMAAGATARLAAGLVAAVRESAARASKALARIGTRGSPP